MTLERYHIPHKKILVTQAEKEKYKKLHEMDTFPHIFLADSSKARTTNKDKKDKKIKIGGDREFQTYIRLALEIREKKLSMSTLDKISKIVAN